MDMYWEIYLVGACIGLVAVPFVRALALRVNALDVPGVGRVHRLPVPRIGGLAIAGTVCAAIVLLVTVRNRGAGLLSGMGPEVGALLGGGLLVFLIGLLDDLRGVKARFKLLVQLAAAGTACACGIRLESVSVEGLFTLDLGWFSWVITIFWIVGVTNALMPSTSSTVRTVFPRVSPH
jgi:UDP-GlcNAc:undecaprenyl-phosphate GlcNAc-1-phosphate transferase